MRKILTVLAAFILGAGSLMVATKSDGPGPRPHQSAADAAWEGLTLEQQDMIDETGETAEHADELIIAFRKVIEDNPTRTVWVEQDTDGLWSIYSN